MAVIDHLGLRVRDLGPSLELYDKVFELLDFDGGRSSGATFHEWNDFSIAAAEAGRPATSGVHVGFAAASRQQVDAWWEGLTSAGYASDGEPGPRPQYSSDYYGAFVHDLDRNSIEAVHHDATDPSTGVSDHIWIRVADLDASKRFYAGIAAAVGVQANDRGERLQLVTESGTVSLLAGPPTRNLHLAIGVDDQASVRDFHAAGLRAGGRDNGQAGERPEYHRGYYGAYVLDPDSNNIEAVFHDRSETTAGG